MSETLGLRAQKKRQTHRLILKAADELFHVRGFTATTLDEIAEKSGVHKQTVLRYFGSKEAIALAFRQVAFQQFKKGLLDPQRKLAVMEYWRAFIEASALEVSRRGDLVRYTKLIESEPALVSASLALQMQYVDLLSEAFSREAQIDPDNDLYAKMLATFLVYGYFTVAREALRRDSLDRLVEQALAVVDFAIQKIPPRVMADPPPMLVARQHSHSTVL